jgi:hypothetical protein
MSLGGVTATATVPTGVKALDGGVSADVGTGAAVVRGAVSLSDASTSVCAPLIDASMSFAIRPFVCDCSHVQQHAFTSPLRTHQQLLSTIVCEHTLTDIEI